MRNDDIIYSAINNKNVSLLAFSEYKLREFFWNIITVVKYSQSIVEKRKNLKEIITN